MSCTPNRFTITKGTSNEFTITIKQDGTTLPMIITDSDTFTAKVYALSDINSDTVVYTPTIQVIDTTNGKITIIFDTTAVQEFKVDKGDKVDRYYSRPTYRMTLDCATENNGNFVVRFPELFVE